MPATDIIKKTYRPSMQVGQVYARPYGSSQALAEIGNVLELNLEHTEDVKTQMDMTALGGGVHAEVRRVQEVNLTMKIADINVTNLTRATYGTATGVDSGTISTPEAFTAALGGLLVLAHKAPSDVLVKEGIDYASSTEVTAAGNYIVRPEGVYLLPDAADIVDGDKLWVTYKHPDQVQIEALTTKAVELELVFGGLNEADGGAPCVLEVFRCSQSIAKQLAMIQDNFGALDVTGSVLKDANRVGAGLSQYYRQTVAAAPAV